MKGLDKINFASAEAAYLVANTPLFLIRKLRTDPSVLKIHSSFSSVEIVQGIRERLSTPPVDSKDRVIPFVLLMALSLKQDRKALEEGARINGDLYRRFKLVAENLLSSTKPVSTTTLRVPSRTRIPEQVIKSTAKSSYKEWKVG